MYKCSKCRVEITKKEYDYSNKNYNNSLCREHQKNTQTKEILETNGLSKRETYYTEGMIKGRIAETLIEELFLSLEYNVFRYGMENTVPGIMKLLKGVKTEVAHNIKRMPDFVIQHPEKKDVYFIEVKFRKDESFDINDSSLKNYPFENTYFIVVSKKHIKCITYKELQDGKVVSPTSKNYLGSRKEFELNKDVIITFCDFAVKFFKEV